MKLRIGCSALAVVVLGLDVARADVWTVNWAGGAHFTDIQPAIQAAADGDVIVVAPGDYGAIQVIDKDLRILGAGAQRPRTGAVSITNLASSRVVVLAGLDIRAPLPAGPPWEALSILNCAGPVRVQGCDALGADGTGVGVGPKSGARIAMSGDVIFSECSLLGGNGSGGALPNAPWYGWSQSGARGVMVEGSAVALYGALVKAGISGTQTFWSCNCGCPAGSDGAPGAQIDGSLFVAAGSSAYGGRGGSYFLSSNVCSGGCFLEFTGRGGDGLYFVGAPSTGAFVGVDFAGGPAGIDNCSNVFTGPSGRTYRNHAPGSSVARYGTLAPTMELPSLLQGATAAQANFFGQPGDLVYLAFDAATSFNLALTHRGVWHLTTPLIPPPSPVGTLDPSGQLAASVSFPPLPAGAPNVTWFVQPIFVNTQGAQTLGTPWSTTLVP